MKLVGVENNIVNTDNSNEDFLIVSDQPIKKYSYYFELEATTRFDLYNAAAVAFVEKDENNEFIKDNTQRKSDTVTILERTQYNDYYHEYTATMKYYQNSLNLELGGYESDCTMITAKNKTILTIIDDKNNFKSYKIYSRNSHYNGNTYYRLGLGINIDLDKKSTTIRYYSNAMNIDELDKNETLLHGQLSINKIFDPDRLYIVIYPQYLTVRHYCNRNHVAADIDTTTKQTSYANYKFFFNKDEIKYTHLYEKYNHPATVVEKLGGVYGKMSDNNFQKLSDHKWDEISKDEKLSLLEQTKGLVPSIDQLKTLEQPIRVITKAES